MSTISAETRATINLVVEKLKKDTASDLKTVSLAELRSPYRNLVRPELNGFSEAFLGFTGTSRCGEPLAVPVDKDGRRTFYTGLLVGDEPEVTRMAELLSAKLKRNQYQGGILAVNTRVLDVLKKDGQLVHIEHSNHDSNRTTQDEEIEGKRKEQFMWQYIGAMLRAAASLGATGVRPQHLFDDKEPVKQVGDYLNVYMPAMGSLNYSTLRPRVVERDNWRCRMPILDEEGKPTGRYCNRDLKAYYPTTRGISRLNPDEGRWEDNHVIPRGVFFSALAKMLIFHLVEPELYDSPEKTLFMANNMNLLGVTALGGIDLIKRQEEIWLMLADNFDRIDACANGLWVMSPHCPSCHWLFHPDMEHGNALASYIMSVNTGEKVLPAITASGFGDWVISESSDIFNKNGSEEKLDYEQQMDTLHQARALVMMGGSTYWQDLYRPRLVIDSVAATKRYVETIVQEKEADIEVKMLRLGPRAVVAKAGLLKAKAETREKIYASLHVTREPDRRIALLASKKISWAPESRK